MEIATQLQQVQRRIRQAAERFQRDPESIQLLAVSKTKPALMVEQAYAAGQRHFGESYLQDAQEKLDQIRHPDLTWHFIGPIQSNKTRPIATQFDWVHSVDRLKIAHRLSEQRPEELGALNLCIQVNSSGETSKSGVDFEALPELANKVAQLPHIHLRGLMTLPARSSSETEQRVPFHQLREALEQLNRQGLSLDTLSMGMSSDLEAAIAEGATIVRVGTDLFGARS